MKCIFVTTMDKFNILPFFCLIFFLYFFVALHLVVFFSESVNLHFIELF